MDVLLAQDAKMDPMMPLDIVPNYRGLTPLKLAAKKGNMVVSDACSWKRSLTAEALCVSP